MLAYRTGFHCFEAIFTHDSFMGIIGQEGSFGSELIPSVTMPISHVNFEASI